MVLKKSKGDGGNTGNTFRKFSRKDVENFKNASFISKSSNSKEHKISSNKQVASPKDWIDDADLGKSQIGSLNQSNNEVKYSFQKKKRWLLPDHLSNEIKSNLEEKEYYNDSTDSFNSCARVSIITKHHGLYTFGYEKLKSFQSSYTPSEDRYFKSWKGSARLDQLDTYDTKYIIIKSLPTTLWRHNKVCNNKKKQKVRKKHKQSFIEESDESDYDKDNLIEFDEYVLEKEFHSNTLSDKEDFRPTTQLDFKMWFKAAEKQKKIKRIRKNYNNKYYQSKSKKYFLEDFSNVKCGEEEEDEGKEKYADQFSNVNENVYSKLLSNVSSCQTLNVYVYGNELKPNNLKTFYSKYYVEANTYPRSFAIIHWRGNDISIHATLHESMNELKQISLKVFSSYTFALGEVILQNTSLFSITEILSNQFFKNKTISYKKYRKDNTCNLSYLTTKLKPLASVKSINQLEEQLLLESNTVSTDIIILGDDICTICCLNTVSICISICQHSYCDYCLGRYIVDHISNHFSPVCCPAFKCGNTLSLVTAMKYLQNNNIFASYIRKLIQGAILRNQYIKQCPRPNCSYVGICPDQNSNVKTLPFHYIIPCVCQKIWCFRCRNDEHWPATCELYEKYQDYLKKVIGTFFDVYGKSFELRVEFRRCPFCHTPVNKNGGCNRMVCVCGAEFCWNCLKQTKSYHPTCTAAVDKEVVFNSLDDISEFTETTKIFLRARKYFMLRKKALRLRTSLKINRLITKHRVLPDGFKISVIRNAFQLMIDCLNFLEYWTLRNTKKYSKSNRKKDLIRVYTSMLHDELNKNHFSKINKNNVEEKMEFLKNLTDQIKFY